MTTYHGSTGKKKQAVDESLETTNRLVEQLPSCNDRDAFARQTNSLPLAKGGKRFVLGLNKKDEEQKVYRSATKAKRIPEKTLIYEMFNLLGTSRYVSGRKFGRTYVKDVIEKCPSRKLIVDRKVEARIKGKQSEQAYSFLSSVAQIMDDVEMALNVNDEAMEALLEKDATTTLEKRDAATREEERRVLEENRCQIIDVMDDDASRTIRPQLDDPEPSEITEKDGEIAKRLGYSRFMLEDVRVVGKQRLEKKNIKVARQRQKARVYRNHRVNLALSEEMKRKATVRDPVEKQVKEVILPPWKARLMAQYPEYYK